MDYKETIDEVKKDVLNALNRNVFNQEDSGMSRHKLQNDLKEYISIIMEIRGLSSVQKNKLKSPDDYCPALKENYKKIGGLGRKSRKIYQETIVPFLNSSELLDCETVTTYQNFCRELLNPFSEEELDLSLLYEVSARLLKDAYLKNDEDYKVHQLYVHINTCYANVNRTNRIKVTRKLSLAYRNDGLDAAAEMLKYLDRDRFVSISVESRKLVLIQSRFYLALYDTFYVDDDINLLRIEGLWKSYELSNEPYYRENAGDYDWNYHIIKCFEHMGQLTEKGNAWGFKKEGIARIVRGIEILEKVWNKDPDKNRKILPKVHLELIKVRNDYFAGRISVDEYRRKLKDMYVVWLNDRYDMYSVLCNIFIPVEFLATVDENSIDSETKDFLSDLYKRTIKYILHSSNSESFYFLLEYMSGFMESFIEFPGGMTFEEMGLSCLAAVHPPTYVHSLQVAQIGKSLCRYLIDFRPECFIGVMGCETVQEVLKSREKILAHVYHGGLCHDFGKICQIDTIFVYGRNLLDSEFDIIKTHPEMGAFLLGKFPSTEKYVNMARLHHKWYDGTEGYPELYDNRKSADKIFVDIIKIADCIDAATDHIGRSYSRGKTLDEVIEEILSGRGAEYSPDVAEILEKDVVANDLKYLISEGRNQNYRNAYIQTA